MSNEASPPSATAPADGPPPAPGADKGTFGLVKEDLRDRFGHYAANIKQCSSVDDFLTLNSQHFGAPLLGVDKIGSGMLFGYCSGYALKTAMKTGAVIAGLGFMSLQVLNYYGYVEVKWGKIQDDIHNTMDLNKDGKIDQEDVKHLRDSTLRILTWGLPSAAGFGTGLYYGLK